MHRVIRTPNVTQQLPLNCFCKILFSLTLSDLKTSTTVVERENTLVHFKVSMTRAGMTKLTISVNITMEL